MFIQNNSFFLIAFFDTDFSKSQRKGFDFSKNRCFINAVSALQINLIFEKLLYKYKIYKPLKYEI